MARLVVRARGPVAIVGIGLAAKSVYRIPGEVDRVEFNVRNRVHQGGTSLGRTETALGQFTRGDQARTLGASRRTDRQWHGRGRIGRKRAFVQRRPRFETQTGLLGGIGCLEATARGSVEIVHVRGVAARRNAPPVAQALRRSFLAESERMASCCSRKPAST